MGMYY